MNTVLDKALLESETKLRHDNQFQQVQILLYHSLIPSRTSDRQSHRAFCACPAPNLRL